MPPRNAVALAALLSLGMQPARATSTLSSEQYRSVLIANAALAGRCARDPRACVPAQAGADLRLQPGGATVRMDWLRTALTKARTAPQAERERLMAASSTRLAREIGFLDPSAQGKTSADGKARTIADAILARSEFRSVDAGPSWWQLLLARFWRWVDRILFNAEAASAHRPWIGIVVEWGLLACALGAVLAYVLRAFRRERFALPVAWATRDKTPGHAETDWDALAEKAVAAGLWREAIHALYWAAVERLAVAGRWRRSAPRTPREHLALLEPESSTRAALAALTRLLETAWYARRPASEHDYRHARALAGELGVPGPTGEPR